MYLSVSIVTTEAPVLSTALVTKDLFENLLTSLNLDLVNGSDITFDGHNKPIEISEENNSSLCL